MDLNLKDKFGARSYKGEIEFIIKDRNGNILSRYVEPNIVKIFGKEILSHRIGSSRIWDPSANSGVGGWVANTVDPNQDFAVKYILIGASFDDSGVPLDINDPRFYSIDPITQTAIPIRLEPGADFDGGLINAVPIAEPGRPLKRIENISFTTTYQPAGTPQLQGDVRALNNIVIFETTLKAAEYNGFGLTPGDYFTITEVALAGGKEFNAIGACECTPNSLFLEGHEESDGVHPLSATASGGDTISLDSGVLASELDIIRIGDQVKIVAPSGTSHNTSNTLNQVSPYYLVVAKNPGGRDIQLDRVPSDMNQAPLFGHVGVYRTTLRIFSHRILSTPVKKSESFEITVRWSIIFS